MEQKFGHGQTHISRLMAAEMRFLRIHGVTKIEIIKKWG
jgi:hypothetical protein